ncbi:uncharacterized protein V6R79_010331 [Siganus canaliculatus]
MRTSGILLHLFYAPGLCLLWITKHAVGTVQLSGPAEVIGANGGSVTVSCKYNQRFRDYTKYWCKGVIYDLCTIVVKTPKNRPNDRSFIVDDKVAGVFTVTMTGLTKSDDDKYWCVISRHGKNTYTGVRLRVSDTVITTTIPTTSSPPPTEGEACTWWVPLRWIIFILLLCCLATVHIVVWRMRSTKKISLRQQPHYENTNVYD